MTNNDTKPNDSLLSIDDAINDKCPWSGDSISADSLTMYKGYVVGFCNAGCKDKFEAAITLFEQQIS